MATSIPTTLSPTTLITTTSIPTTDSNYKMSFWEENEQLLIGIVAGFVVISLALVTYYCVAYRKQNLSNGEYIKNALVAIIGIGDYDHINVENSDIADGYLADIPVNIDIDNLKMLFGSLLNYTVIPTEFKSYWTEQEVIDFLTTDIGAELFDTNNSLKYDGLVICVSCHGIENKIITSDYRTIEKSVIHRIISINHPLVREIPRIVIFDSCEGSAQREYIRASTINTSQYTMSDVKSKDEENEHKYAHVDQGKVIELVDISTGMEWTHDTKNPDYKLAQIHASNVGFQAKCSTTKGSYLIYEFIKAMMSNIEENKDLFLVEIMDEIQRYLHDDVGKQQIITNYNSFTQYLRFKVKNVESEVVSDENNQEQDMIGIEMKPNSGKHTGDKQISNDLNTYLLDSNLKDICIK
eukprot:96981_1